MDFETDACIRALEISTWFIHQHYIITSKHFTWPNIMWMDTTMYVLSVQGMWPICTLEKLAGVLEASSHVTSKASHYMHSVDPPERQPPEHQPHHNKFFFPHPPVQTRLHGGSWIPTSVYPTSMCECDWCRETTASPSSPPSLTRAGWPVAVQWGQHSLTLIGVV